MNIREQQESREHEYMSPYASFSDESRGRDKPEPQCDIRTIYQRDRVDYRLPIYKAAPIKHKIIICEPLRIFCTTVASGSSSSVKTSLFSFIITLDSVGE